MKKAKNYYVFGGQYEPYCYGGTPTLLGAKRLANKNQEYYDNWQGWHTPSIYHKDDTEVIESHGYITHNDGDMIRIPRPHAIPGIAMGIKFN